MVDPTTTLFHMILLFMYSIFSTVYLLEALWTIRHKMILNKGSIIILIINFVCLGLKLITAWMQIVEDLYFGENNDLTLFAL